MTISFDLNAVQEAAAAEILAKRQESDPTLTMDQMFKKEALYALGLTREQMGARKREDAKVKLETLSEADLEEVRALIESKVPPPPEPTQLPA
jgi:hypothetical protein